jgi:MrfA Zn-binding domain
MARKSVRRSQAVTPFGVGSLADFPNQSLMAAGLDVWPDQPECQIRDDRLARRLGVEYFRAPPPPPQEGQKNGAYLPFVRFPLWHFCPRCRTMKKTNWNDAFPPRCDSSLPPPRTGAPPCTTLAEKKRWRMVPLRFVVACENGHIDDFPWLAWAHSRPGQPLDVATVCSNPLLRFNYTGKAGLMGLLIKCEGCGAKARSLMGSAGPNSLKGLLCSGNRPWLGPHGNESCASPNPPRMLQRGATNLHFSKIASSILIPPFSDPIRKIVDDPHNWSVLTGGQEDGALDETRLRIFAEIKKLDFKRLKEVVMQKLTGVGLGDRTETEEEYRYSEYTALLESPADYEQDFVTEKPNLGAYEDEVSQCIDQIVLVKKLAETRVLTGFSRINPPPYREFDQNDRSLLSLKAKQWLPGIRVYGEGIFFTLKKSKINDWLTDTLRKRYGEIFANHKRIYNKLGRKPREMPSKFILLHTLAHVLIRRLSFECGYGSSSLRERIYCWEGGSREMNGILIYTAAGDSEGTMGGLVEQGKPGQFELLIRGALEDALWCSTDPLCIESRGQGIDSLNRAACHACGLLPETSCEEGNRFLDRVALIGTPENSSLGFFGEIVRKIMAGAA